MLRLAKYDVGLVGTMIGGYFDDFSSQVYQYVWRYEVRAPCFRRHVVRFSSGNLWECLRKMVEEKVREEGVQL